MRRSERVLCSDDGRRDRQPKSPPTRAGKGSEDRDGFCFRASETRPSTSPSRAKRAHTHSLFRRCALFGSLADPGRLQHTAAAAAAAAEHSNDTGREQTRKGGLALGLARRHCPDQGDTALAPEDGECTPRPLLQEQQQMRTRLRQACFPRTLSQAFVLLQPGQV